MNCPHARDRLPGLLYGDLAPAEKGELEKHLAQCPACRAEYQALQGVRQLLGTAAAPPVRIDLPRLYQQAAEQQARRLRGWRRLAVAATGVAALFAVAALGLRLEVRVEAHQLVLRWGPPPAAGPEAPAADPALPAVPGPAVPDRLVHLSEDQVQLLGKLVHALADDLQALEQRQREDATEARSQFRALRQESLQRCAAIERTVDALYVLSHKGE